MPCINSNGELSANGRRILAALALPATVEQIRDQTELPLYLIRSGIREMVGAGLVAADRGTFQVTESGQALLARQS
jgi:predicted transcriptional regulator